MDDEAARLVDTLLRSGAAWKATALQQSMSIATIVLAAAMASESHSSVVRLEGSEEKPTTSEEIDRDTRNGNSPGALHVLRSPPAFVLSA